jgi:cobalt-zinc-cadmium efflux system membrane fusion protein
MIRKTPLLLVMLLVMGSTAIALFMQAQATNEHEQAHKEARHDNKGHTREHGHANEHKEKHADEHGHGHGGEHAEEIPRGPHGGRLLSADNFALEITIYETGVRPEFQVYPYADKEPLSPAEVDLHIELARLGNRVDTFEFSPQDNYLRGHGSVSEPHSFDVTVSASYRDQDYRWHYENHEGRTRISAAMADEAGIGTEIAGPVTLSETLDLTGRVRTDPDRLSRVRARFPGVIQKLHRALGDTVRAGDTLATVQSNESLQNYTVQAPIDGLIVVRNAQIGEATGEEPMFVIADLTEVWVELDVFGRDLPRVSAGQAVEIETFDGYRTEGVIDWVSPLAAHASQSVSARIRLPNPEGALRPGQFAQGHVTVAEHDVKLAVRQSAVQRFRDFRVVFARYGDTYEVRMLETGRQNRDWVEVLGGLEPGTEYVTANSYLIKADIEKAGASHDH